MWTETLLAVCSFCLLLDGCLAQRPPGVPDPNVMQMQQPPAQQQYQQQPPAQQQQQYQQQPPVQQQQYQQQPPAQQQQYQQQPPAQQQFKQHPAGAGHGHQGGFGAKPHDADHIKEHLKDVAKPKEEMTEEELEFHYFKLHDYDNNNKLDGTEITKAITHFHHDEEDGAEAKAPEKKFEDEEISNIVDMVLKEDDLNNDGYIEYAEFIAAQRKARENPSN